MSRLYARVLSASEHGYSLMCVGFVRGFLPRASAPPLCIDDYVCVVPAPDSKPPQRRLFQFERPSTREEYQRIIAEAKKQKHQFS